MMARPITTLSGVEPDYTTAALVGADCFEQVRAFGP